MSFKRNWSSRWLPGSYSAAHAFKQCILSKGLCLSLSQRAFYQQENIFCSMSFFCFFLLLIIANGLKKFSLSFEEKFPAQYKPVDRQWLVGARRSEILTWFCHWPLLKFETCHLNILDLLSPTRWWQHWLLFLPYGVIRVCNKVTYFFNVSGAYFDQVLSHSLWHLMLKSPH